MPTSTTFGNGQCVFSGTTTYVHHYNICPVCGKTEYQFSHSYNTRKFCDKCVEFESHCVDWSERPMFEQIDIEVSLV
jgi:hypothetical protein